MAAGAQRLGPQLPDLVAAEWKAARAGRLQRSLALMAGLSSLPSGFEVAYEHYRGSYSRRIMWTPVLLSGALLGAGIAGALNRRAARTLLPAVSLVTLADGVTGFYFHIRGIHRKPGGWRLLIPNIAMGPPPFAPLLFTMSAFMGVIAARMLPEEARGRRAPNAAALQRDLALACGVTALLNGVEALYSHYANNFRYKVQWTPVALAPVMAAVAFAAPRSRRALRLLPLVAGVGMADGVIGFYFHARGIGRRPGGLRQLWYNVMYGPPIFAPLLFAASGLFGVLAGAIARPTRRKS